MMKHLSISCQQLRNLRRSITAAVMAVGLGAATMGAMAQSSRLYTLNADFDLPGAVKFNIDHAPVTSIIDGLELLTIGTTFPVLWIANAAEDTVSKIDTTTGTEIARYRTWFGPSGQTGFISHPNNFLAGPAPSRTAVDLSGNAYVLNRHFDGRRAMVTKILNAGGVDRNGNGTIDTSTGSADIKILADTAPSNGQIDVAELRDERIAWVSYVGSNGGLGRALCIAPDGNLWVGLFNTAQYYKISSVDGSVLAGPVSVTWSPYGCLVDANGTLWSASLGSTLGRITNAHLNSGHVATGFNHGGSCSQNYGIALGNNRVYLACISGGGYISCDPVTGACFRPPSAPTSAATGISVDGGGNIWVSQYQGGGVFKHRGADNAMLCSNASGAGSEHRGVIIDASNDAWQIGVTSDSIKRFRGSDCAAMNTITVGDGPYVYSDASGFAAINVTSPTGTWTVTQDAGAAGAYWGTIGWTATVPNGASVVVSAAASDDQGALAGMPVSPVSNGGNFTAFGRYVKVEARLTANTSRQSPQLLDIAVATRTCDVDKDGDIDRNDINAIASAAKANLVVGPADVRDADRDGRISTADVRACTLRCTRSMCSVN